MSKSKPSRDAQAVNKVTFQDSWNQDVVYADNVLKLLASQRRGMVRNIWLYRKSIDVLDDEQAIGKLLACDDLLRALRGKR